MLFPQVTQKVVIVKETLLTKLAQWMTFVRAIVVVTNAPMMAKLRPTVVSPVICEQLQPTKTNATMTTAAAMTTIGELLVHCKSRLGWVSDVNLPGLSNFSQA